MGRRSSTPTTVWKLTNFECLWRHTGPESFFCAYPGLTSWAINLPPLPGLFFCADNIRWVLIPFRGQGRLRHISCVNSRGQECPRYTGNVAT